MLWAYAFEEKIRYASPSPRTLDLLFGEKPILSTKTMVIVLRMDVKFRPELWWRLYLKCKMPGGGTTVSGEGTKALLSL